MCGIVYAKNTKDSARVNEAVSVLFEAQKGRGTEGFGFVGYTKDTFLAQRVTDLKGFTRLLDSEHFDEILVHHRLPTSTSNRENSCHPFAIDHGTSRFYFVHNGIVSNHAELRTKHLDAGIQYASYDEADKKYNDSEALAFDFVRYITGQDSKMHSVGSVAFICIEQDRNSEQALRLYYYHNSSSPLTMLKRGNLFALASENLPDEVKHNVLYCYEYKTAKIRKVCKLKIMGYEYQPTFGFTPRYERPKWYSGYNWEYDDDGYTLSKKDNEVGEYGAYTAICDIADDFDIAVKSGDNEEALNLLIEADSIARDNGLPMEYLTELGLMYEALPGRSEALCEV